MADKVGFLITTTPGDWRDYIKAFTDVWVVSFITLPAQSRKGRQAAHMEMMTTLEEARASFRPTPTSRSLLRQAPERR